MHIESNTPAALHQRCETRRGRACLHSCVDCGEPARDWSSVHDAVGYDVFKVFEARCRPCHIRYDYASRWGNPDYRAAQVAGSRERALRQWEDPAHRARVSAANTGHKHTEESRRKMALAKIGTRNAAGRRTPEQCKSISDGIKRAKLAKLKEVMAHGTD